MLLAQIQRSQSVHMPCYRITRRLATGTAPSPASLSTILIGRKSCSRMTGTVCTVRSLSRSKHRKAVLTKRSRLSRRCYNWMSCARRSTCAASSSLSRGSNSAAGSTADANRWYRQDSSRKWLNSWRRSGCCRARPRAARSATARRSTTCCASPLSLMTRARCSTLSRASLPRAGSTQPSRPSGSARSRSSDGSRRLRSARRRRR
mmetsp:Transcript_10030/g.21390  ORF Transcript_10030/g.21390 Transcript_10030/m.21390 type:complete len:205 (+) Transcript_10030:424-1038(+)